MLVKSRVKYIQSLSQKKLRDSEGLFVAEGPKIISELITNRNIVIDHIYSTSDWVNVNKTENLPLTIIDEQELSRISFLTTPNQVLGLFRKPEINIDSFGGGLSIILDSIQDPGNMGTIIRCADWFGIKNIICSKDCVDNFSPKVVQSSMGSVVRVNVQHTDLESFLKQQEQLNIFAATLDGEDITQMQKISEGFLIIGNESKGIRDELLSLATRQIKIPRVGRAESLNAGVATGILLSHLIL